MISKRKQRRAERIDKYVIQKQRSQKGSQVYFKFHIHGLRRRIMSCHDNGFRLVAHMGRCRYNSNASGNTYVQERKRTLDSLLKDQVFVAQMNNIVLNTLSVNQIIGSERVFCYHQRNASAKSAVYAGLCTVGRLM